MDNNLIKLLIDIADKSELEKQWQSDASSILEQYNIDMHLNNKLLANEAHGLNIVFSKDWTKPVPGSPA